MDQALKFAEKYFGDWQLQSVDSQSIQEVEQSTAPLPEGGHFQQAATAGPLLLKAFYRGPGSSEDSVPVEVIS